MCAVDWRLPVLWVQVDQGARECCLGPLSMDPSLRLRRVGCGCMVPAGLCAFLVGSTVKQMTVPSLSSISFIGARCVDVQLNFGHPRVQHGNPDRRVLEAFSP